MEREPTDLVTGHLALGVSILSDVLGAAAADLAWMVLCLTVVDSLRQSRRRAA